MAIAGMIPNLVIAQRVIDKIAAAAVRYIEDETGEAMVGLVTPGPNGGIPTLYVLDTISPDDSALREMHTFQQGDARQDELIWWLQENWHVQRQMSREADDSKAQKFDVPLRYLGDWHKQPGYMIAPSGGDLGTALSWLDDPDNNMDYLLAPIVTLGHPGTVDHTSTMVNYVFVPQADGTAMRIDFWYIHRDVGMFQPITPVIYPDDQLPKLAEYPWHLIDEQRMTLELARFEQNQMFTSVILWDTDGQLPLEVCIASARMGARKIFLIATPWNYPKAAPQIRLAAFTSLKENQTIADVFEEWWESSTPAPEIPGWQWSDDKHLIDYIHAIEAALGMPPAPAAVENPQAQAVVPADEAAAVPEATDAPLAESTPNIENGTALATDDNSKKIASTDDVETSTPEGAAED